MNDKMQFRIGLTTIELVVIIGISSILIVSLIRFIGTGFPISKSTFSQVNASETARVQLERLTKTIRQARESATGSYPLVEASPNRIIFYVDANNDSVVERIRYELIDGNLERGVILPVGEPYSYPLGSEEVTVVAKFIVNDSSQPLFTYYTGDYPDVTEPLSPTDLTEVKYIQVRLLVDSNVNEDPDAIDVRSQVQLRNLKTNLGGEGL